MGVKNVVSDNSLELCLKNLLGCMGSNQFTVSFQTIVFATGKVPHWPSQTKLIGAGSVSSQEQTLYLPQFTRNT